MKRFSVVRAAALLGIGCVLLLVGTPSVVAQGARNLSTVERRLDDFNKQNVKAARDEMTREMQGKKPTAEERRLAIAKKAQIKEDFGTLQTAYNDIVSKLHAKEVLSDEFTFDVAEKINKSAARLRQDIEFPVKKVDETKNDTAPLEAASLKLLCVQIHAFLTNPIFETGVLDIVEAERARDILDKIVHTSADIRQRLGKND